MHDGNSRRRRRQGQVPRRSERCNRPGGCRGPTARSRSRAPKSTPPKQRLDDHASAARSGFTALAIAIPVLLVLAALLVLVGLQRRITEYTVTYRRLAILAVAAALSTRMLGAVHASSDDASNATLRALERPTTTVPPTTTTVPVAAVHTARQLPPDGRSRRPARCRQARSWTRSGRKGSSTPASTRARLGFASRNPKGELEGMEIDLVEGDLHGRSSATTERSASSRS